jgi:hypothetical protein
LICTGGFLLFSCKQKPTSSCSCMEQQAGQGPGHQPGRATPAQEQVNHAPGLQQRPGVAPLYLPIQQQQHGQQSHRAWQGREPQGINLRAGQGTSGHRAPQPSHGQPYRSPGPSQVSMAAPFVAASARPPARRPPNGPVSEWPGSEWLPSSVGPGVRIKGARLAVMQDGILQPAAGAPHAQFQVYSTSGQAETWPVDMQACLCACPNDSR